MRSAFLLFIRGLSAIGETPGRILPYEKAGSEGEEVPWRWERNGSWRAMWLPGLPFLSPSYAVCPKGICRCDYHIHCHSKRALSCQQLIISVHWETRTTWYIMWLLTRHDQDNKPQIPNPKDVEVLKMRRCIIRLKKMLINALRGVVYRPCSSKVSGEDNTRHEHSCLTRGYKLES